MTESDAMTMHHGESFFHLANTYRYLMKTLVEAAQNAIDADAETVLIAVDMKTRLAIILDDGKGVTREKFKEALRSIGKGIKGESSLGRFGLGMISPLNKCRQFTLTSDPMGTRGVNRWEFVGADIRSHHGEPPIPYADVKVMPKLPSQFEPFVVELSARWRTEIRMEDIIENRTVTDIDPAILESQIRTKLRRGMLQKGTTIYVVLLNDDGVTQLKIDAAQPTGEPLDVVVIEDPNLACGRVTFTLFKAKEVTGKRNGIVDVMQEGDNTAIEWREFRAQAVSMPDLKRLKLTDKIKIPFDALGSGFFEGTISIENVELVADRDSFKDDPALTTSYVAIYEWFLKYGQHLYQEDRAARREERYKDLGERALARLYERIEGNPTFNNFVNGLVGFLPENAVFDSRPKPFDPTKTGVRKVTEKKIAVRKKTPEGESKRRQVPAGFALSFTYDILAGSRRLWELDIRSGLLTFNIRHPIWVKLDETPDGQHTTKNDENIVQLQLYTAFQVLLLLGKVGPDDFPDARDEIDPQIEYYAEMFIVEEVRPRKGRRK